MPKKGGRKPSARKAQSQAALSRVIVNNPQPWEAAGANPPDNTQTPDKPEPEPEPELATGYTGNYGSASNRADELELVRAMFEEELSVPSLDDPYTFSLKLSVPDSAQRLRSWTVTLVLDVVLPAQDYPQATQLRVRCSRCDKRALRSLHRSLALALTEDHSIADNGPKVCFAAQWLTDHAHSYFNVAEVARNPAPRSTTRASDPKHESAQGQSDDDGEDGEEEENEEEEAEVGGGHGVDLCVCVFPNLRPSLPPQTSEVAVMPAAAVDGASDTAWVDEAGRLRRRGGTKRGAGTTCTSSSGGNGAPVGKLLSQWVRRKYFVGLLLRGTPAVIVLQTNVAPE